MRISVCMATYNGEKYIHEQVHSILKQLGAKDELIVSDDHSTDATVQIVESFQDPRIKVVYNTKTRGYTQNFQNALAHAGGDIFFLADQDDVWADDKVKVTLQHLQSCDLVNSNATYIDGDAKVLGPTHFEATGVKKGFLANFMKTRYVGACMAFNRKVYDYVLPFPSNSKLCAHDYWIAIVAELRFKTALIDQPLLYYRRHEANATNPFESNRSLGEKLHSRLYCLMQLLLRVAQKR